MFKNRFLYFLLVPCMAYALSESIQYRLYDHGTDHEAVAQLLADNYKHVVCQSYFDADGRTPESRLKYAQAMTQMFQRTQLKNWPNYWVMVAAMKNMPVGYVAYTIPRRLFLPGAVVKEILPAVKEILPAVKEILPAVKGRIDQLVVDENYRGQDIGVKLCNFAFEEFKRNNLKRVDVLTTSEEVGERFYVPKLGFKFLRVIRSPSKTSDTFFWRIYLEKPSRLQKMFDMIP